MTDPTAPSTSAELALPTWRTRRLWMALAVALMLLALVALMLAVRNGSVVMGTRGDAWHLALQPAVTLYVLIVFPWLQGRWALALASLQGLGVPAERIEQARVLSRRGEWLAVLVGLLFSVVITSSFPISSPWLALYDYGSNALMFGLMAQATFDGGSRTRRLARLVNADLKLDLFDRQALVPLARWGQTITLTFVGGTCLSLLFQSHRSLFTIASAVIYSTMLMVSLGLFFTSTWSLHVALRAARERELADVQRRLAAARAELKRQLPQQPGPEAAETYRPVVMLGLYEKQVLEASTWPFNPKIVKEVAASVAVPVLIYFAKFAIGVPGAS